MSAVHHVSRSQIFQHYIKRQKVFRVSDNIDSYVSMGVPDIARASFLMLLNLTNGLGFIISEKNTSPSTKVVCIGILTNTQNGIVSIPPKIVSD